MEKKKIIYLKKGENKEIISLNLKGLNNLKNIHLSMDYLIDKAMKSFAINDIESVKEFTKLAERINGDWEDKRVVNLKYRVLLKEAINKVEGNLPSIIEKIKVFNQLKDIDGRVRRNFDLEFDEKLIKLLNKSEDKIKGFQEEVKKYIEKYIEKENEKVIELLECFYFLKDENLKNKKIELEGKLLEKIKKVSLTNKDGFKEIFKEKYELGFYYSEEIRNCYIYTKGFENIEKLLEGFNDFNLLYKFNNSNNEEEKKEICYLLAPEEYINAKAFERDFVFNKVKGNVKDLSRFKLEIENILKEFKEKKEKNMLML